MSRVAVIGAGVIGLSTAVNIQKRLPWLHVTLITDELSPNTTGDGSAGLWEPYLLQNTPADDITRWAGITYKLFRELWQSPIAGDVGVSLVPLLWVRSDAVKELPAWINIGMGVTPVGEERLQQLSRDHNKQYRLGFHFVTFVLEPTRFLPYLLGKFKENGGVLERYHVKSLEDIAAQKYDVIINCTGLQSRHLAFDSSVVPIRGQVMRVKAPWVNHVVQVDNILEGLYIIPNQETVVLGGTKQAGDWNTNVYLKDKEEILSGCQQIMPSIHGAEHIKDWVGLRPGRPTVRVEKEVMKDKNGKPFVVIHNYGHGGSGVTLCWGCAEDAVKILQQTLFTAKL